MALVLVATAAMLLYNHFASGEKSAQASFVGYRSFWEPTLLLRLRFCTQALPILTAGYEKVGRFAAIPRFPSCLRPFLGCLSISFANNLVLV